VNLLLTLIFAFFILLLGIVPFGLLYPFSNVVRYVLCCVFGYRKEVMRKNLAASFPDLSPKERKELLWKAYLNLTDVILEGIKAFSMPRRQINKRHHITNTEALQPYFQNGQSMIVVASHYANWEWGSLSADLQLPFNIVAFYKPLSNRWLDKLVRWSRSRHGTHMASIYHTAETFEAYKNTPTLFIMVADQSPSKKQVKNSYWIPFLGQQTAFLYGPEKYARAYDLPMGYTHINRIKRGYYTVSFELLPSHLSELPEGLPTRIYAQKIEEVIRRQPANWLWSHRRWKHTPS